MLRLRREGRGRHESKFAITLDMPAPLRRSAGYATSVQGRMALVTTTPDGTMSDDEQTTEDEVLEGRPSEWMTPEQRERERRIWRWLILGGIVFMVLFLFAFWPVMAGRLNAAKQLDEAQALLGQAENSASAVDKAVAVQLSPAAEPSIADYSPQFLVARRELKQAVALVDAGMPHLADEEQSRGQLIETAAKARLTMLALAPAILATSEKAVRAQALADSGWQQLGQASAEETTAVDSYAQKTAPAVETASVHAQRALELANGARTPFSQAATAFPQAGFDRYVAYAKTRAAALHSLIAAAKAWLAGDTGSAAIAFRAYTAAAAKAQAAEAALPYAPGAATSKAFRALEGRSLAAYSNAKSQAVTADKALQQ